MSTGTGDWIATLDDSVRLTADSVEIIDRGAFPDRMEWVRARSAEEVADAIREMVTQSSGPLCGAFAGLSLTARQVRTPFRCRTHTPGRIAAEFIAAHCATGSA